MYRFKLEMIQPKAGLFASPRQHAAIMILIALGEGAVMVVPRLQDSRDLVARVELLHRQGRIQKEQERAAYLGHFATSELSGRGAIGCSIVMILGTCYAVPSGLSS